MSACGIFTSTCMHFLQRRRSKQAGGGAAGVLIGPVVCLVCVAKCRERQSRIQTYRMKQRTWTSKTVDVEDIKSVESVSSGQ
jgi:hypothetical protein